MDMQYVIVYLIVAFAAWQLVKRFMPQKRKPGAKACSSCAACEPGPAATRPTVTR